MLATDAPPLLLVGFFFFPYILTLAYTGMIHVAGDVPYYAKSLPPPCGP